MAYGDELSWLTIAVIEPFEFDPDEPELFGPRAQLWWVSVSDQLVGAAFQYSALDYEVTVRSWGLVFEVCFDTDERAEAYRGSEAMRSAIDQLGPLRLEVTSGRGGGSAGARVPRRDRPLIGSGSAALPLPEPDQVHW